MTPSTKSSVAASAAPIEAQKGRPVHSGPMGAVDALLNAWDVAWDAWQLEGSAYDAQRTRRAISDLRTASLGVEGLHNTVGLGCNHRTVRALILAAATWSDLQGTPKPERVAAGQAADLLAKAIRLARSRFFMQGAGS